MQLWCSLGVSHFDYVLECVNLSFSPTMKTKPFFFAKVNEGYSINPVHSSFSTMKKKANSHIFLNYFSQVLRQSLHFRESFQRIYPAVKDKVFLKENLRRILCYKRIFAGMWNILLLLGQPTATPKPFFSSWRTSAFAGSQSHNAVLSGISNSRDVPVSGLAGQNNSKGLP